MAVAIALAWSATASTELSAAESETASVGPASREQPRLADAIGTLGNASSIDASSIDFAAELRSHLSRVQWSFEIHDRLALKSPTASEEVAAGKPQRDPCYVNSPLTTLRAHIGLPTGMFPDDIAAQCRAATPALPDRRMVDGWAGFEKRWSATCMRHRPLYFEEVNAERYGYTPGYAIQPLISAGHFFATIPTLPYQMITQPPCECTYTLGHYRPGSCVPYRNSRWPMHLSAGVVEVVAVVALVALIP